ncbi:MAG: GNAT family N-acetyltransferase [Oscillospiraceae bacterium]|nr:GNAT family N-acetyltransferase [Oscillospiraceae bacterium]
MKTILTERCALIPLSEVDFEELTPLAISQDARQYLGGVRPLETALNGWRKSIQEANEYPFTVRLRESNTAIGLVMIAPHHNPADMEVSFLFMPAYWGHGYAKETVKSLLAFCGQELRLNRVVSETQTENMRSRRLLESLGYVVEDEIDRFGKKQNIYSIII